MTASTGDLITEQLTCPICLEIYKVPTTLGCGHTYCRYCIAGVDKCPLCRCPLSADATLAVNAVMNALCITALNGRSSVSTLDSVDQSSSSPDSRSECVSDSLRPSSPWQTPGYLSKAFAEMYWNERMKRRVVPSGAFIMLFMKDIRLRGDELIAKETQLALLSLAQELEMWGPVELTFDKVAVMKLFSVVGIYDKESAKDVLRAWTEEYVANHVGITRPCTPRTLGMFTIDADQVHKVSARSEPIRYEGGNLPVTFGRHASNSVVLKHSSVSSFHFQLIITPGKVSVMDLGSTVGTMTKFNEGALENNMVLHFEDKLEATIKIHYAQKISNRVWNLREGKISEATGGLSVPTLQIIHVGPEGGLKTFPVEPEGTVVGCTGCDLKVQEPMDCTKCFIYYGVGAHEPLFASSLSSLGGGTESSPGGSDFLATRIPKWRMVNLDKRPSATIYRKLLPFTDLVPLRKHTQLKVGQCVINVHTEPLPFNNPRPGPPPIPQPFEFLIGAGGGGGGARSGGGGGGGGPFVRTRSVHNRDTPARNHYHHHNELRQLCMHGDDRVLG